MYCNNCGAQVADGAVFCDNCGCRLTESAGASQGSGQSSGGYAPYVQQPFYPPAADALPAQAPAKKKKKALPLILGIVGGVVLALAVLLIVLGATAPQRRAVALTKYASKMFDTRLKADTLLDYFPPQYVNKLADEMGCSVSEFKSNLQSELDDLYENRSQYLGGVSYKLKSVKATSTEKITGSELEDIRKLYDFKISAAKKVNMTSKASINGITQEADSSVIMIKVGGRWYVEPQYLISLYNSLY